MSNPNTPNNGPETAPGAIQPPTFAVDENMYGPTPAVELPHPGYMGPVQEGAEVEVFDRELVRQTGLAAVNGYIDGLMELRSANMDAMVGAVAGPDYLRSRGADSFTDLRQKSPEDFFKVLRAVPEIKELHDYSPAGSYRDNLMDESVGTGVDPRNVRGTVDAHDRSMQEYKQRLDGARIDAANGYRHPSPPDPSTANSHVERGIFQTPPTQPRTPSERKVAEQAADLDRSSLKAGIRKEQEGMWAGADIYTGGPLLTPREQATQLDPIRDDGEIISDAAVRSRTNYRYGVPGKNAYGQVTNHQMGPRSTWNKQATAKQERVSRIEDEDRRDEAEGLPHPHRKSERGAQKRYDAAKQEVEELNEDISTLINGASLPRGRHIARRLRRSLGRARQGL